MWAIESTLDRAIRLLADQDDFERRAFFPVDLGVPLRIEYAWSVWPRRCYRSDRRVWGRAVRVQAVWTGPGEPIIETRWLHRDEAVIMMLKRNANGTV